MKGMEMLRRSSVFAAEVMEVFDRSPTDKELVSQSKVLCRDYIHSRLHWLGSDGRNRSTDLEEHWLRCLHSSVVGTCDPPPNVYRNVARQLNITCASETIVSDAFISVSHLCLSTGVTWGKIVSLYAVAGALAVDCVSATATSSNVHTIVDCMGEFVRKSLVSWFIKRRGGWVSNKSIRADIYKVCSLNTDPSFRSHWLVAAACACGHNLKAVVFYLLREKIKSSTNK
ncbi:LOW QUALITY PROTEIN: bcl-2-related ovarian killer protein homolog A [Cyprinus carpio]|uniref:LOW QUALITY PROTEIN: bcl-2-related ovarian killer protein homolog A n=1 Tax=Cyprinus carpio TaxID=7962 RepID=A0A9R0AXM2_CYPCA|nr:LOW QUALITY PROTEIN: bcl-2-related ovarian killer protein homolog A [Cyprinus carpio]